MALEKRTILGRLEIENDGTIFVKEYKQILEDGIVISSVPHRTPIQPSEDISHWTYPELLNIAPLVRTNEKIAAFSQKKTEQQKSDKKA